MSLSLPSACVWKADESDRYAAELDRVAHEIDDDRAPHGSLAVQHGAEAYRTRARWARQATKRFQSRSEP